ncbi:DUF3048 domain-containing protein [Patescibacteria group bacterium]
MEKVSTNFQAKKQKLLQKLKKDKNMKSFFQSKKFMVIISFIGLYLLSTGASLAIFSYLGGGPSVELSSDELEDRRSKIAGLPKTEECPINGAMFTEVEREIWEKRRPLTVMVENHTDARPQSGVSKADVVYEAVAEGGITRFLTINYCGIASENHRLSGVRSARVYFIDLAAEYGEKPIFLHWGGANSYCNTCPGGTKPRSQINPKADAYALLDKLGWRMGRSGNDFDGGMNVGYPVVLRDQYRLSDKPAAWEHSTIAFTDEAYKEANTRGFNAKDGDGVAWDETFVTWGFVDGSPSSSPQASKISLGFWDGMGDFTVEWEYDGQNNNYKRSNGGKSHTDWEGDKPQLTASNVVVQFTKETGPVDTEKHMLYDVVGEGKVLIFQNGNVIKGTWEKESRTDRTKFYDDDGKEVSFVRGTVWVEILPKGNDVNY